MHHSKQIKTKKKKKKTDQRDYHPFIPLLPHTIMPIPASFLQLACTTTASVIYYPYPPPIVVKHHDWYFYDADFFIIVCGIVFGLHRRYFEPSVYFRTILSLNEPGRGIPRGTDCFLPIPFDGLSELMFTTFLYFIYHPTHFSGSRQRWLNIRQLAIDWQFPHHAAVAIQELMELRLHELSITHRMLLNRFLPYEIFGQQQICTQRKLFVVQEEDDLTDDDESSIDDETT